MYLNEFMSFLICIYVRFYWFKKVYFQKFGVIDIYMYIQFKNGKNNFKILFVVKFVVSIFFKKGVINRYEFIYLQ